MITSRIVIVALAVALTSACDSDDPANPDSENPFPALVVLPTLGTGNATGFTTTEVAVYENFAYTATCCRANHGNGLLVWDVSTSTPQLRHTMVVGDYGAVGDVQISEDGQLLVAATEHGVDAGFIVFDRTDPINLVQLSVYRNQNTPGCHTLKVAKSGARNFVYCNHYGGVFIVDITNPSAPTLAHNIDIGDPYVHDVFVRDGLLFTAEWHGGMSIYDIGGGNRGGSPTSPVRIGGVKTVGGYAHNFWWFHDQSTGSKRYVFVGEEGPGVYPTKTSGDVHVIDISDMTNPREVAFFRVAPSTTSNGETAGPHNFGADEESGVLYTAFYNGGVRALDVRGDLGTCPSAQRSADGRCDLGLMGREVGRALNTHGTVGVWGVVYRDRKLYASDMLRGLHVIDASPLQR